MIRMSIALAIIIIAAAIAFNILTEPRYSQPAPTATPVMDVLPTLTLAWPTPHVVLVATIPPCIEKSRVESNGSTIVWCSAK